MSEVVARSTWYTHNPGGKKATRLAERQSRIDAIRRDNDLSRDNSGSGTSPLLGKRPAEEGEDPPEGAKRVARSGSVPSRWTSVAHAYASVGPGHVFSSSFPALVTSSVSFSTTYSAPITTTSSSSPSPSPSIGL
ncbi:hypothetical protein BJ322DRAFT_1020341 [Thelephora terrestris]|uniref:Uncharacterized protein n=1 Tax=Thelephora terrestris TaxID=56493 RepID=A0A9P6HFW5_9AGAM|nr:hypothetical protein BJ322DRAFT_1020341 [Thelephora terrestris]